MDDNVNIRPNHIHFTNGRKIEERSALVQEDTQGVLLRIENNILVHTTYYVFMTTLKV